MTQPATTPPNEAARLACLASLGVLDSPPEPAFDQITRLAAELCGVPIALVSLVDAQRQWFKANVGLEGVSETHRDLAFCAHTILADGLMEVADATQDPRFAANPLVTGGPMIRFYAGFPISMPQGERVGTLCIIDQVPRQLTPVQRTALQGLAGVVASTLLERQQRLALSRDLRASEASYRAIVEGQSELISLAGEDGTLAYVNRAYAEFFGLRTTEMVGRNLLDFVAEHDRSAVLAHLREVVAGQQPALGVNRMVSADGRERWVAWTNRCIPGAAAGARVIHSVGRDITEQREAEQALADNEAHSRMLYESTPAMLHSIDPQGRLLNVTETWLQRMGYTREEVLGRSSADFLTPASAQRAREVVLPAFFKSGRCDDVEYQMVRRDGSVIDVLLSAILERDAQGQARRSLAVVLDISERRRQQALTEQALAEKETLLKEVYHRVKNNLQVVQSLLNLQRHALPEGLARDAMQDSVQRVRAMALVHEKLYQSGNLAAISLRRYTRELIEQIAEAHAVDRARVTLELEIADIETGLDSAVPYGLLVTELITNSLKHAFPAGRGGLVRISLVRQRGGDLLTVSDNGVGYAGEPSSAAASASMGLQLADSLARQLGGELCTESDGGATSRALLTRL